MDPARAAGEAARRKVNRAAGLLRDAARDLASLADGNTIVGVQRVHDSETVASARELIATGAARHGAVDVIVIARPTRRDSNPTTAPPGAKETTHE